MSFLTKFAGAPLVYIKLGIIALIVVVAMTLTWKVRSAIAKKAQDKAVAAAIKDVSTQLDTERAARSRAEGVANTKLDMLLKSITNIQVQQAQLKEGIAKERLANKKFYEQALPPGGYEQWKQARALASPASSPTP